MRQPIEKVTVSFARSRSRELPRRDPRSLKADATSVRRGPFFGQATVRGHLRGHDGWLGKNPAPWRSFLAGCFGRLFELRAANARIARVPSQPVPIACSQLVDQLVTRYAPP